MKASCRAAGPPGRRGRRTCLGVLVFASDLPPSCKSEHCLPQGTIKSLPQTEKEYVGDDACIVPDDGLSRVLRCAILCQAAGRDAPEKQFGGNGQDLSEV